ncbi:MAG: HAD family hydrolase [Oscillatoria sp. PMC 1051.18]|nr:HAD family hydrolase [Oscillatoria sp. PMC 1050.18]MEC5030559.1 HAD family hydrolase [Oscillatoria sp. PMC 1051.18]
MLRLITDFDGPIMDVSDRYYCVYQLCLEETKRSEQTVRKLSKEEFWQLKRSRTPEVQIAQMSGLDPEQGQKFARMRREIIHNIPFLIHDKLSPGAVAALEKVQSLGIDLVVLTMRRLGEIEIAFDRYNLRRFFRRDRCYALAADYPKTTDVSDKTLLMAKALRELPPAEEVWMVGDTEADAIAAQTHGIKVIGVLCGIRSRAQLEKYQPNSIVNNLSEAVDKVIERSLFKQLNYDPSP